MDQQPLLSNFSPLSVLSAHRNRVLGGVLSAGIHLLLVFFAFYIALQTAEPGLPETTVSVALSVAPALAEAEPEIQPQLVRAETSAITAPTIDIVPDAAELKALPVISPNTANAGESRYLADLWLRVLAGVRYPRDAQLSGIRGVALVHVIIARDGTVQLAEIEQSSGSALLDESALLAVSRYQPLLPLPDSLGLDYFNTVIPVRYGFRAPTGG